MSGMIVIPASLRSDFIHMAGMTIHIALESTIHIAGIRSLSAWHSFGSGSLMSIIRHMQSCAADIADAEDTLQESLLKAYTHIGSFDRPINFIGF